MPIRINLLAEAQELEEMRRRDPLKRVILIGVALVLLVLAWSGSLVLKNMMTRAELNRLEGNLNSLTNEYRQILLSQSSLVETKQKLDSLNRLAANRFLVGNLLNAFQKATLDSVQLVRLKLDQSYVVTEEVKPKPGSKTTPKPATSREKIVLTLSAKDKSPTPGDGVSKLQEILSEEAYFKAGLGDNGFRLLNISPTQTDVDGKSFLLLTLEGRFPEKTR